jgi:hypothetical protein
MLSGCYTYLPVGAVEPAIGAHVAAALTEAGSDTLARSIGPAITTLRGDVISLGEHEITLAVTSVTDRWGQVASWRGERVLVPRPAVRELQQRRLSPGRSVLLAAALLAASVAAWEVFEAGIRGGSVPNPGGGGEPR